MRHMGIAMEKKSAYSHLAKWFEYLNDDCGYEQWSQYLILKLSRYPLGVGLDVGCGGGFPSLPLAIARPDISVTSLDSTEKKVKYVGETAKLLGISNHTPLYGRAEELAHDPALRESFDIVTARAVASLPVLSELCLPFVKQNGAFVAMKSGNVEEELAASAAGIKKLGASPFSVYSFSLVSHENGIAPEGRTILIAKKLSPSPALYPRPYAKIKKTLLK